MASLQESLPTAQSQGLEPRAAALERVLERHQLWVLGIWTIIYFAGTIVRARGKPFWYDEVFTVMEARQHSLAASLRAFGDIDWMPPACHVLFYVGGKLTGYGEAGFRLPVIAAFWVFCLCLYLFARRRVSIFFALMALFLPFSTSFQSYSFEARSYAIMLAFCGIALVAWQAAAEDIRRPWSLILLAIGIAGATAFQYWGVFIYFPLACAEAYRNFHDRRVDWPVWIAFSGGVIPLVASLPIILRGTRIWSPFGEMQVRAGSYFDFYWIVFRVSWAFMLPAVLLLGAWFLAGGRKEQPKMQQEAVIPIHEWIAAAALLLIPVVAISLALAFPPHDFMRRYAVPSLAGYALLLAFLAARFAGRRSSVGLACMLAALAPFVYLMARPEYLKRYHPDRKLQATLQAGPVMVDDVVFFLPLWYYTPSRLQPHLTYITSGDRAAREKAKELIKMGVPLVVYDDFTPAHKQFLLLSRSNDAIAQKVRAQGGTMETVWRSGHRTLFRVYLP
jgi:hypothetical protein